MDIFKKGFLHEIFHSEHEDSIYPEGLKPFSSKIKRGPTGCTAFDHENQQKITIHQLSKAVQPVGPRVELLENCIFRLRDVCPDELQQESWWRRHFHFQKISIKL